MRMPMRLLKTVCLCSVALTTGCGNKGADPQVSAADQQKIAAQQRQTAVNMQISQINNSNLPPDQKQRLIDQLRTSGPR